VLACTAAIACAATVVGFTAVSVMPGAPTAFAFALPLFAVAPPLPTVFELPAFDVFGAGPGRKSESPLFPAEPLDGADVCGADVCGADVCGANVCGAACGELAGWAVAAGGGLGGGDVLASSKAANGCEVVSWLDVDGCIRDGGVSEAAVGRSGAILDILDTR
jgi:hypothetical protein